MIPGEIWLGDNIEPNKVWIGNIIKCTKFKRTTEYNDGNYAYGSVEIETEVYKKNAVLIEITNGGFIDLDFIKNESLSDYKKIYNCFNKHGWKCKNIILPTIASEKDSLYVDKKTLIPFFDECNQVEKTSVKQLKKSVC